MDLFFYKLSKGLKPEGFRSLFPFIKKALSMADEERDVDVSKGITLLASSADEAVFLNEKMWTSSGSEDFIPHVLHDLSEDLSSGLDIPEEEDLTKNPEIAQFVRLVISCDEGSALNSAELGYRILFLTRAVAGVSFLKKFTKVCYFFSEAEVGNSRALWKLAKNDEDFALKLFTQNEKGVWSAADT